MSYQVNRLIKVSQDLFFVWVLIGAISGYLFPKITASGSGNISIALGVVMLGMGLTITLEQLKSLRHAGKALIVGVFLQFTIMPLLGWFAATVLKLPPMLALGVILVGASPGGTASEVITFLARGDVSLSVALTTASTLISPIMTPAWIWLLSANWVEIQPLSLIMTTVQFVLLPVLIGIVIRYFWTPSKLVMEGILPLVSMFAIVWIIATVVGLNHERLLIMPIVIIAVIFHNVFGLILGYMGAAITGQPKPICRTISIEVGMQNSGLAVALAIAHFDPVAAIPGAIFSVCHNLTGSLIAAIWRKYS
ncbi:Na+-dependent transporter-like protein [Tolypothrix tenuis PCC 7101]|uniref:Na+-dependent transporter-like protein n=1 Tax=Tolypothrix tenuis PCC 7101 TaxID=231146 RepID=A0A1Z4N3U9_9CYAN|nr:bile acid:sodium symporter family protein [Aulosira sp. FACHB-113]BAZ00404.1 Na+-dependent transporter-like protein [Tolypothrix tenuis PCC 7101]BAZ75675.1 Na+-dependent transporter-like protein [Aulosira laxa NIES-50]